MISGKTVVVAMRSDPFRVRRLMIKTMSGKPTKAEIKDYPFQLYLMRLTNDLLFAIRVSYDNEKKLNSKFYSESHARTTDIIDHLKIRLKQPQ